MNGWDQKVFEETLQVYLSRVSQEKVPAALNKKGFFIALRAYRETPRRQPVEISASLRSKVNATYQGKSAQVPVLYVLAAKRASAKWDAIAGAKKNHLGKLRRTRGKRWLALIAQEAKRIEGSRRRGSGFLQLGWLDVVKDLGPLVRNKGGQSIPSDAARRRGVPKGRATPARPGSSSTVTIENSAQSRRDRRGGLDRYGRPPFEKAFADETADTIAFLDAEVLKELTEQFNKANK